MQVFKKVKKIKKLANLSRNQKKLKFFKARKSKPKKSENAGCLMQKACFCGLPWLQKSLLFDAIFGQKKPQKTYLRGAKNDPKYKSAGVPPKRKSRGHPSPGPSPQFASLNLRLLTQRTATSASRHPPGSPSDRNPEPFSPCTPS